MRTTGKDPACGTVSTCKVDKIDFLITKVCPEVGEEEERSMAYIAIATYTLSTNSLTPACVYIFTYLSPSLYLSPCVCTRYPRWNIAASQRLFCGIPQGVFLSLYSFLFWRSIVLARQGFFKWWVGLLLQSAE